MNCRLVASHRPQVSLLCHNVFYQENVRLQRLLFYVDGNDVGQPKQKKTIRILPTWSENVSKITRIKLKAASKVLPFRNGKLGSEGCAVPTTFFFKSRLTRREHQSVILMLSGQFFSAVMTVSTRIAGETHTDMAQPK